MKTFLAAVFSSAAIALQLTGVLRAQVVKPMPVADAANLSGNPPALPPVPSGKTTILGGGIRNFDPVRDQFTLQIYGQRPMKILFDERTQVFRDGARIPVRQLGAAEHASVQTVLDGSNVFAVSVHILSGSPEGECQGRVLRYDPRTGELTVASDLSPEPVRLHIEASTTVGRVGERGFAATASGPSDLVAGALISATFEADAGHRNVAREINVLAVPGAIFTFNGNVTFLDMHAGALVLADPRDGKSYQIHFDSAQLSASAALHPDENVMVKATYDGTRYVASQITVN